MPQTKPFEGKHDAVRYLYLDEKNLFDRRLHSASFYSRHLTMGDKFFL